jgi:hypothetical protein
VGAGRGFKCSTPAINHLLFFAEEEKKVLQNALFINAHAIPLPLSLREA